MWQLRYVYGILLPLGWHEGEQGRRPVAASQGSAMGMMGHLKRLLALAMAGGVVLTGLVLASPSTSGALRFSRMAALNFIAGASCEIARDESDGAGFIPSSGEGGLKPTSSPLQTISQK